MRHIYGNTMNKTVLFRSMCFSLKTLFQKNYFSNTLTYKMCGN